MLILRVFVFFISFLMLNSCSSVVSDMQARDIFREVSDTGNLESGMRIIMDPDHCLLSEEYHILKDSWYVAENELSGFEIAIPRKHCEILVDEDVVLVLEDLRIAEQSQKQGMQLIWLERDR